MADNRLAPPPFREALVERAPLTMLATWQRWLDLWWQQHALLWQQTGQGQLPLVSGTGLADKVSVWATPQALTYDTLLHYDRTQHWLGLGTATPSAPLTFAQALGQKVHLWASGLARYGFGIASSVLQVFHQQGARTDIGMLSTTDGATFTALFSVSEALVSSQVPFKVASRTGLAYDPPLNVWVRTGSMATDALHLGGGDVAPRWPLDVPGGLGHVGYLSTGGNSPSTAVDLRSSSAQVDKLVVNCPPVSDHTLVVGPGWTTFQIGAYVGIGIAPVGALSLRATNVQFDNLGVSYAPVAGVSIRAGTGQWDSLGVAGPYDSRWHFTNWGTSYFNGSVQCANYVGFQGAPDTRFVARFYSHIYCDGVPYTAAGGPWVAFSDRRLKRRIAEIPHPLETMTALHGVTYEYTDTAMGKPPGVRLGVIAQEVEAVMPAWVGELSGYKTTQLSQFEALTIESFKALTQRIAALETVLCL